MKKLPPMTSLFHEGLLISIRAPLGWELEEIAGKPMIRLFGKAHPEHDDYRPTMSYMKGQPEGFGEDWLDTFGAAALENLETTYDGFRLLSEERYVSSSFARVLSRTFSWHHQESGMRFHQLQAFMLASPFVMYLVNAATIAPLAEQTMPVFDAILKSTRIMNPQ